MQNQFKMWIWCPRTTQPRQQIRPQGCKMDAEPDNDLGESAQSSRGYTRIRAGGKESKVAGTRRCLWRTWIWCVGAFCSARHQATDECWCLGQTALTGDAHLIVLKWTHSILQEPTFCSEWEAQTRALNLSWECNTIGENTNAQCSRGTGGLHQKIMFFPF